jgi:cell division protease FtsH
MAKSQRKKRAKAQPSLLRRLHSHFGGDPATLPVVEQQFAVYERPNLYLALEELLGEPNRRSELVGVVALAEFHASSLARLSRAGSAKQFDEGPVEYLDVALPADQHLACVKQGLYLIHEDGEPLAVLVAQEVYRHLVLQRS